MFRVRPLVTGASQDLRQAWRSLRATPRLTITASACAALGLAAAMFMTAIVDAVLLASPPIPDAERLVRVWSATRGTRQTADVSYLEFLDIERQVASVDAIEAAARTRLAVTTDAGTERLRGESVTPGYFDLVGVQPIAGRLFDPREYAPGADRPVIISHDLWQRRFGGRADALGMPFRTRPTSRQTGASVRTIVGVMPPGFVGTVDPDVSDFWLPMAHYEPAAILDNRMARSVWVLGRLRPDATMAQARDEITALASRLAVDHPAIYDRVTLIIEPFGESWRERFRLSLITLLAAAGLLLLIACTNVATLLLARLADRESELRLRAVLGAPQIRVVRQLLFESLMIAAAGGVAGLALAAGAIQAVAALDVFALPPYVRVALEPRAVVAGLALVLATGLLFGVLPARLGSSAPATLADHGGSRTSLSRRQRRHGRLLVMTQVAFTCLLLVGSVLLFSTYRNLVGGDLGFRTSHLLRLALSPDPNVFPGADTRLALAADITRAFDGYPGVRTTTVMAGVLPPWFDEVTDVVLPAGEPLQDVGRHAVDEAYLEVMGMRLLEGRPIGAADRRPGARAALASASLAARLRQATGRDALGQILRLVTAGAPERDPVEIVGVVNDVLYNGPLRPRATNHDLYLPLERGGPGALSIAVHTDVDAASLIEPLSRELGRLATTSPQHWISTMEGELGLQYRDARLYAALAGGYGAAAGLLAVLGVYSVLANAVARRRREIGVRMAVGARRADIVRLVLLEGARLIVVGTVAGLVLAALGSRLLEGLLYGVRPGDPVTLAVVAAGLLAAGLVASLVPSLRASRTDPLAALRSS